MSDSRPTSFLAAACLAAVLLNPLTAQAQPGGETDLVIGSEFNGLFAMRHFPDQGFSLQFGAITADTSALAFYSLPSLYVGAALDSLVVGAGLEAGIVHVNPDGPFTTDQNFGLFGIDPFFEYYFSQDSMAPFIGAHAGPNIQVINGGDPQVWFSGGAYGGLAFFVDNFSVAPKVGFDFVYVSNNERAGYEIFIGIDIRGWIGLGGGGGGGSTGGGGGGGGSSAPPPADPEPANDDSGLGDLGL